MSVHVKILYILDRIKQVYYFRSGTSVLQMAELNTWGRFLKGGISYTRYNSYSRDKSAILGITIRGIKRGSRKHYLSLE